MSRRKILLVDAKNLYNRFKYVTISRHDGDPSILIEQLFYNLQRVYNTLKFDRIIFCDDHRSWRYSVHEEYKGTRNREYDEVDEILLAAFDRFIEFMEQNTNNLVLKYKGAEADDLIARLCIKYNKSKFFILSSDADFIQLVDNKNVTLYCPLKQALINKKGVFKENGKKISFSLKNDGKIDIKNTGDVMDEWWKFSLFCKIFRGDTSDNIPSIKKGIRQTKLIEMFNDSEIYEEFFSSEEGLKELFDNNKMLIDLNHIPDNLKEEFDNYIVDKFKNITIIDNENIEESFNKYCEMEDLETIKNQYYELKKFLN